jgi:hypothetical protein
MAGGGVVQVPAAMFAKCRHSLGFITQGFPFGHARRCVTKFRHGPSFATNTTSIRLYGYAARLINVETLE